MKSYKETFDAVSKEVEKVVIGQKEILEQMLICILSGSNALLEGYPGLAKTLLAKTLAQVMELKFSRIQSTPDLMPSDITGTYIIEEANGKRSFRFQPGPLFANIVLADEINRATPKTQSALLEAMQEKQVTVGNSTFKLDMPFFVLATQNPIEQEGSLALTESVFINGQLKTGKEILDSLHTLNSECIAEDEKGIKLYDINSYTLSLDTDGKLKKTKCLLYTLPYNDEMISITTKTGKRIQVTKNHPFLVNENGFIVWKKAEELTKFDYLVNPAKIRIEGMSFMPHEKAISMMNQKPIQEIPFDNDFAFWIAFLLSDGSIGEKYVEAVQKNYPEALDRFIEISKRYGFKVNIRLHKGCRHAKIYSKPLVEYLKVRFGIKSGREKEIPTEFISLPSDMLREFLKAFISLESSLRDNRIVFTQKSKSNVNVISYMLLREGILPWIRHDGRIFRMKIQGNDFVSYLKKIGWVDNRKIMNLDFDREIKSSFRVVPVDRKRILRLVEILGLNSFHTLKNRQDITSRSWYGSYKGIKEGETVMSVDSMRKFADDIRHEIETRKTDDFRKLLENSPREFSANIGTPMTEIAHKLNVSHNQVWNVYQGKDSACTLLIKEFLSTQYSTVLEEAEKILCYCEMLLSEDVFYDKIRTIEYANYEGFAFGLTVFELKNYVGGFGGCGINHNTYPLPEAQADRFLLKIRVDYPTLDEEEEIAERYSSEERESKIKVILDKQQLFTLQTHTRQMPIANDIKKRVVKIIDATRKTKQLIQYGASPRATIGLILASKARAILQGRNHVSNDDINALAYPILRHRIILNFEAERKGLTTDDAIREIITKVK